MKSLKKGCPEKRKKLKMKKNNLNNIFYAVMTLLISNNSVFAATGLANEIKHFGFKFLQMSLGVILSIVVIFVCLLFYKRFKLPKIFNQEENIQNHLLSSNSIDDAIEHFIKDSE